MLKIDFKQVLRREEASILSSIVPNIKNGLNPTINSEGKPMGASFHDI